MQQGAGGKLISSFPPLSREEEGNEDRKKKREQDALTPQASFFGERTVKGGVSLIFKTIPESGSNSNPPFKAMTKRKWDGRREGFRVNTTREEAQGPSRPTSRGRFSESWKRLSSRQGSTKRSGLAAQQAAVRTGTASVCRATGGWHGLAGGWQRDV